MEGIFRRRESERCGRSDFDSGGFNRCSGDFQDAATEAGYRFNAECVTKGKSGGVRRGRADASITVTLCLSILLTAVLILGLVEAARFYGLKRDAEEWTKLAAESLAAEYQPYLLEKYNLFFLDGGFGKKELKLTRGEAEMDALLAYNLMFTEEKDGINLFRMQSADAEITGYILATDDSGKVFMAQTAKVMRDTMGQQAAKKILNKIEDVQKVQTEGGNPEQSMKDAGETLEGLKAQLEADAKKGQEMAGYKLVAPLKAAGTAGETTAAAETNVPTETNAETTPVENPMDTIKPLRAQGILSLVLTDGQEISPKGISLDDCLLKRDMGKGTCELPEIKGADWYERILMQKFVTSVVGNYQNPKLDAALSYGTEYLICGKATDEENLKETAEKLLLIRETANYLYLQKDAEKKAEALAAAALLAGASVNPAVVEAVQQGILAAWAYAESVCDVKALFAGGKVPLVKDATSWQTQLSKLGEAAATAYSGNENGWSYEEYLDALLYTRTIRRIAYRSMDIMEKSMQNEERYAKCRMNNMIVGFQTKVAYEADTLFTGLMAADALGGYEFIETAEHIYQ